MLSNSTRNLTMKTNHITVATPTDRPAPAGLTITIDDGELAPAVFRLDSATAWEFSQFLKRCTWHTCESLSEPGNKDQTQRMIDAVSLLQRAFAEAGYAPR